IMDHAERKNMVKPAQVTEDFKAIIQAMRKDEGDELVDNLLKIFLNRIPKDMEELASARETRDFESLSKKSHLLAGSLISLRFEKGFELARSVEKYAFEKKHEEANRSSAMLIDYLAKTIQSLQNH
ncbi:MAG: Hpt domain-containing protein, partial [Flavobacteriales bacterium]|nr:Hpt domain-containing protein [Flavobacteriales bacterium]